MGRSSGRSENSGDPRSTGRFSSGKDNTSLMVISTFTALLAGSGPVERREKVVALEDVFANAQLSPGGEAVGEPRNVSLWNHSSAPDGQQLFGGDVELEAPFGEVGALAR